MKKLMASAEAFLDRLKMDEEFAKKIAKCNDTSERMVLIKQCSFDFTEDNKDDSTGKNARQFGRNDRGDGMCLFQNDLKCLRDIIYVACRCPIERAYQ